MMKMLQEPWPWSIAGPLIGLMVPALLLIGSAFYTRPATRTVLFQLSTADTHDTFGRKGKKR